MNLIAKLNNRLPTWSTDKTDPIYLATVTFLSGIQNRSTRRSYNATLKQFFGLFHDVHPKNVLIAHVELFVENLRKQGNSESTISQKLSAISAYYEYMTKPQGASEKPLISFNPVKGVKRMSIDAYSRSKKMTVEQAELFFRAIDRYTLIGSRDYAYFKFLYYSSLRETEVLEIKKSDIIQTGSKIYYRYQELKNRSKIVNKEKELPPPVWEAIQDYWWITERRQDDEGYIFKSLSNNGSNKDKHVDGSQLRRNFQKYCRIAGISGLSVHSLRHLSAAEKAKHLTLQEVQQELGHKSINTTQIYLDKLTNTEDKTWDKIGGVFE